jgi:16S rRNA (adenine1518-N6/adenine1519-N6)-dimethyltransferase
MLQAKKSFGQNFLVSPHYLGLLDLAVASFLAQTKPAKIIEIGPGMGALTKIIIKNIESDTPLECWEIDPDAVEYLKKTDYIDKIELIQRDALEYLSIDNKAVQVNLALKMSFRGSREILAEPEEKISHFVRNDSVDSLSEKKILRFAHDDQGGTQYDKIESNGVNKILKQVQDDKIASSNSFVLISNLPYNVGSRILIEMALQENQPLGFLVMLQKEVGQKLTAKEKNINLLGAFLRLFYDFKIVANFPRSAFSPQPKIESVLVQGLIKKDLKFNDAVLVLDTLKKLLIYPSKTLANNLKNLDWDKNKIEQFLAQNQLDKNIRLEWGNYIVLLESILRA